jgi:hypothetical protein
MKTLRTTLLLALAALTLSFGLFSCDVSNTTVTPKLLHEGEYIYEVKETLPPGEQTLDTVINAEEVRSTIDNAGYKIEDFKSITVESATIEILNSDFTFDNIISVKGYLAADSIEAPIEFASLSQIAKGKGKGPLALVVKKDLNFINLFKSNVVIASGAISTDAEVVAGTLFRVRYKLGIIPNA